ncbi:hypothetical protein MCHK_4645 [Mesorhizobium huakuii 7653R]|nr:hypothetical protein MCHK_4645 [Mesorhizobium huakuii 7653R]
MSSARLYASIAAGLLALVFAGPCFSEEKPFDHQIDEPMVFAAGYNGGNCDGCEWLIAEGTFVEGTSAKLLEFLTARFGKPGGGPELSFHFNSNGGNVIEALRVGEIIREWGLDTSLGKTVGVIRDYGPPEYSTIYSEDSRPGVCASACAYAVLGGVKRSFVEADKLGVHQHYSDKSISDPLAQTATAIDRSVDQLISGIIMEYVMRMGVDPHLVSQAASVAPWDEMRWLTPAEIVKYRIDNMSDQYSPPVIIPFGARGAALETMHTAGYLANLDHPTKHRVFCKGAKRIPYIAYIYTANSSTAGEFRSAVAAKVDFSFKNDEGLDVVLRPKLADVTEKKNADNTYTVAAAWSFDNASQEVFQTATAVSAIDGPDNGVAHYAWDRRDRVSFQLPASAEKLVGLAFRNCVE